MLAVGSRVEDVGLLSRLLKFQVMLFGHGSGRWRTLEEIVRPVVVDTRNSPTLPCVELIMMVAGAPASWSAMDSILRSKSGTCVVDCDFRISNQVFFSRGT